MIHAAARFKLISGSQVRVIVRPPSEAELKADSGA
jgi:hypothetical protein